MGFDGADLLAEISKTNSLLERGDRRIDEITKSVDDLYRRLGRPGAEGSGLDAFETKSARAICLERRALLMKHDDTTEPEYEPNPAEIRTATKAGAGFHRLFRTSVDKLDVETKSALSAFSFSSTGWMAPPEVSTRVLTCIPEIDSFLGLCGSANISSGSLVLPIDNSRPEIGTFACATACWSDTPNPDLTAGLGRMEIGVDPVRAIICVTSDLLADAGFSVENWVLNKASVALRDLLSRAVIRGSGVGQPSGLLSPRSGIPVGESASSVAGMLDYRDLLALKFSLPEPWLSRGSFIMNPQTFALLMSAVDATQRPIMIQTPLLDANMRPGLAGYSLFGSPIHVVPQMPSVEPGALAVGFGDWRECYLIVWRKTLSMLVDPYSAGFCTTFKFDARVGGCCRLAVRCQTASNQVIVDTPEVVLLYLGGLVRKKDADGNPTGEPSLIYAAEAFLAVDAWPVFAKNTAVSAARVIAAAIQGGAPEPRETKLAIFLGENWTAARGFALIDGESLIGWRHVGGEDGPLVIAAERGNMAAKMLEQIRQAA